MPRPTTLTSLAGALAAVSMSANALAQERYMSSTAPARQNEQPAKAAAAGFPDEARVAYVDIDRVAALSGEGKAAAAKLDDLRTKKSAEVSARGKQVEALQAKLAQGDTVLNDVARARLQREFQRAQIDFQRFSEDAQAEVQEAQRETLRGFNARLFPVIGQIAQEKKLWAVFGNDNLMWYNPALDLTEEVAKRLDAAAAAPKPGAPKQ